ncbi:putative polysaccharide biosynthesis protein [Paenibacillus silvae]|uniref:putative polysaccharide biosynthesis protein n=1 Tax=Paenibacillus silvae TaxID=1325358 RepID=UPI00200624FF|nr:oligosaccharide flippase family protein [Paenibacillus silvae]MCK6078695.1 oligosaccharide flippase family protein [Paenibacillus silvae]MCK6153014.1 oligosaccharide flippase family protein [Paenibacillus silvae]MCK6271524.1 oligosaccharide flippase family protein [Paenibacillus silvae]
MKQSSSGTRLLQGAFILGLAAIISKIIGAFQKIPLQNLGGDGVFGIYNTVYPLYMLIITLAAAGLPLAVSKFVAEQQALGQGEESRRIIRISSMLLAGFGFLTAIVMYASAPWIAALIGNQHVIPSIRAASLALLCVPLMTGLRGYFQGMQQMMPTAISQVVEQTVRVTVMIVVLLWLIRQEASIETVAAGAMLGSVAGGCAGLAVMLAFVYWHCRKERTEHAERMVVGEALYASSERVEDTEKTGQFGRALQDGPRYAGGRNKKDENAGETGALRNAAVAEAGGQALELKRTTAEWIRTLLIYAIPVCLGSLAVPLMNLVDTFTVPRLLQGEGLDEVQTMVSFGIYNRGLPLVQLVTMLATSLSVLFIPAMAEVRLKGGPEAVRQQAGTALRWFWLIGLAASAGLAVLADPINRMLYGDAAGTEALRYMALTAAGSTVSIIAAALLQGLGAVRAPAFSMLTAAGVKVLLNVMLVPALGISGAAIAGAAAYMLAAGLNVALLARLTAMRPAPGAVLAKPALVIAAMSLAALGMAWAAEAVLGGVGIAATHRLAAMGVSLLGIAAGTAVFVLAAARTGLLTATELAALPKLGPRLAGLLRRLRVLR